MYRNSPSEARALIAGTAEMLILTFVSKRLLDKARIPITGLRRSSSYGNPTNAPPTTHYASSRWTHNKRTPSSTFTSRPSSWRPTQQPVSTLLGSRLCIFHRLQHANVDSWLDDVRTHPIPDDGDNGHSGDDDADAVPFACRWRTR